MAAVLVLIFILKALLWVVGLVLGVTLLAVVLTLAIVLFVPVNFSGRLEADVMPDETAEWGVRGAAKWQGQVAQGWFLLRMQAGGTNLQVEAASLSICGFRVHRRKGRPQNGPAQKRKRTWRPTFAELRLWLADALATLPKLIAALHLHGHGDVTFGFWDPSLTGMVLGALAVARIPHLRYEPDWLNTRLDGRVDVRGRIYGIQMAVLLWRAFWRSPLGEPMRRRLRTWFLRENAQAGGRA